MIGWRVHLTYEQRILLAPYFEGDSWYPANEVSLMRWKEETE